MIKTRLITGHTVIAIATDKHYRPSKQMKLPDIKFECNTQASNESKHQRLV